MTYNKLDDLKYKNDDSKELENFMQPIIKMSHPELFEGAVFQTDIGTTMINCIYYWSDVIPVYKIKKNDDGEDYISDEQIGVRSGWMCKPIIPDFEYTGQRNLFMYSAFKTKP